jgi:deazaflavin-dependent oxidoreductase (nitroreductase family)
MRWVRRLAALLLLLLVPPAAAAAAFVLGVRSRAPWALGILKDINRVLLNPWQMRSAGSLGAFASVIRHTGRRSGRLYDTPVVAVPTRSGFVIALPYGPGADWLQNVVASGRASIMHEGALYAVERPEVVPMSVAAESFPAESRRAHRMFGIVECLRVTRPDAAVVSAR